MNCGQSNRGFCLLFHTPCTDQVLFPISTEYIVHNERSITFPLAQGRQAYWQHHRPACAAPCDLGFEHVLGLPESPNHSSREVSLLASQGWPSLWLTHLFGVPGAAPPVLVSSWPIMAPPASTSFSLSLSLYIYIYMCVCVCVCVCVFQGKVNS